MKLAKVRLGFDVPGDASDRAVASSVAAGTPILVASSESVGAS